MYTIDRDPRKTIRYLESALRHTPNNAYALRCMYEIFFCNAWGVVYDPHKVHALVDKALRINPNDQEAQFLQEAMSKVYIDPRFVRVINT